jgi:hypothetical protein
LNAARNIRDDAEADPMNRQVAPALLTANGGGSTVHIPPAAVCYLLNDAIKAGMVRAAAEMPYPAEPGLPRAERAKVLKALDRKIERLESDLVKLHREADKAGIVLRSEPKLPGKLTA